VSFKLTDSFVEGVRGKVVYDSPHTKNPEGKATLVLPSHEMGWILNLALRGCELSGSVAESTFVAEMEARRNAEMRHVEELVESRRRIRKVVEMTGEAFERIEALAEELQKASNDYRDYSKLVLRATKGMEE